MDAFKIETKRPKDLVFIPRADNGISVWDPITQILADVEAVGIRKKHDEAKEALAQ